MYYKRAGGCERVETSAKTDKRAEPVCCLQGVSLTSSFQAPLSASQEACCQAIDAPRPQPFCYPSPRARFCLARYAVIICDRPVLWDGRTPPGLEKSCETPSSRASWARFFFMAPSARHAVMRRFQHQIVIWAQCAAVEDSKKMSVGANLPD